MGVRDWGMELEQATTLDELGQTLSRPIPTSLQRASEKRARARTSRTVSRVRELRVMRGLTQARLASVIESSIGTIRKAELGYLAQLRVETLLRLANGLGVGAADLFPILRERIQQKKARPGRA